MGLHQNSDQRANGPANRTYSDNERVSLGERLSYVLGSLESRREELTAVLPRDVSFDAFHATINQALRANPELLDCTARSLVNACVKAAYDGLRVDGREAVIVWEIVTVRQQGMPDRKEKQARYMPMYQGLVQQVLRGGMVLACEADVIYANDEYDLVRGSNPQVHHRPLLVGDRGEMVAVYNVATLPSGYRVTAYLTRDQVIDIAKESRSGWDAKAGTFKGVWKRWPREQWKKTILRQHRKTLPVGRGVTIRDMEMSDEFPQFDKATPHPQLAAAPPRPQRRAAIEDNSDNFGVPLDLRNEGEGELVEHADRNQEAHQSAAATTARPIDLPADEAEWDLWMKEMVGKAEAAADPSAVNAIWSDNRAIIDNAPEAIRNQVTGVLTEKIADLATGSAS